MSYYFEKIMQLEKNFRGKISETHLNFLFQTQSKK